MDKKGESEQISDKKIKRIKTRHVRTTAGSTGTTVTPQTPPNVDYFRSEDEESKHKIADECNRQFQDTCYVMKEICQKVYDAKAKNDFDSIQGHISDVSLSIMKLKKLNRLEKHRCKRSRDVVIEGKKKVDSLNLQHQNLLYEAMHLQKEYLKCLEFKSEDEDIELVPLEQFHREAPVEVSKMEVTSKDPHELHLARLHWELEQRKALAKECQKKEVRKEQLNQEIKKLKDTLKTVHPTLQSILEASDPLHDQFGMPMSAMTLKHKVALCLPKPLYHVYVEACAYKDSCDKTLGISVEGSVDEAKVFEMKISSPADDSSESDQEEQSAKKRHRHSTSAQHEKSQKNVLDAHPMSLGLTMDCNEYKLSLEFFYLAHLNIVTVKVQSLTPSPKVNYKDILDLSTLLKCLLSDDDDGKMVPNLTNKYLLKGIECKDALFTNDKSGLPYRWAQHISGLHFMSTKLDGERIPDGKIFASYLELTICSIRERLISRISLNEQVGILDQSGAKIFSNVSGLYPTNMQSQLKKFSLGSWDDVKKHPKWEQLVELDIICKESIVFTAVIERGSAVMTSVICVAPNHPVKIPVFLLFLVWNGTITSDSSVALRELEEEVNVLSVYSFRDKEVLLSQMRHLITCFDVFIETDHRLGSVEGPCEFSREKVMTRPYSGKSRSRPYLYMPSKGIFTQRE